MNWIGRLKGWQWWSGKIQLVLNQCIHCLERMNPFWHFCWENSIGPKMLLQAIQKADICSKSSKDSRCTFIFCYKFIFFNQKVQQQLQDLSPKIMFFVVPIFFPPPQWWTLHQCILQHDCLHSNSVKHIIIQSKLLLFILYLDFLFGKSCRRTYME